MKKLRIISFVLCVFLLASCVRTVFAAGSDDQIQVGGFSADIPVSNGCSTLDAQMPLLGSGKLLDTAGAAILYEMNTQTLMYGWNPDLLMEPASLVKIMTAVVALEQGSPSDEITVTNAALRSLSGSSTTDLKDGERISLDNLLNCLMVGSSNDAAVVIAHHISGSQEAFVEQMNRKAQQLGMQSTVFSNPHGLPEEQQVTTARDMGKLLSYASDNETFMTYFSRNEYTVPATNLSEQRQLTSTNYMMMEDKPLYYDSRVTGGRTGITAERNRCLAVTAEGDSMSFVGVILDAVPIFKEDGFTVQRFGSYEEMGQLLRKAFGEYRPARILMEGQSLMQCSVVNGANGVAAMASETISVMLPLGIGTDQLSVQYQDNINQLQAPVVAGDALTKVQIWYGNICIAQSSVIAGNGAPIKGAVVIPHTVENGGKFWRILLIIFGILVLLVAFFYGALLAIRYYRRTAAKAQRKRRRSERRRSR